MGRYEAGLEAGKDSRKSYVAITESDRAVIKPNMYPYNYVKRDDAQTLAKRMNYESCTSSLVFGVQWNLTLKYIETKKEATVLDINTKLTLDSTTIGNYNNNLWNITNADAKYSIDSGKNFITCPYQKKSSEKVLLTTGADESFSLMNIYDMSGNVHEWTLEFYNKSYPCVSRGGSYSGNGSGRTTKGHGYGGTGVADNNIGFRIGVWK